MLVAVLYNSICDLDVIDAADVTAQLGAVIGALEKLGHDWFVLDCNLDLHEMRDILVKSKPDVIFNLIDALAGHDSLLSLPLFVWDSLGIPYTGASAESLVMTTNKVLAKSIMVRDGLPTPSWRVLNDPASFANERKIILKNTYDHGSRDMTDDSVFTGDSTEVQRRLRKRIENTGRPTFAEEFIDGRDISVSMLSGPEGMEILPPTEVDYSAYPDGKPRIVGFNAKWKHGTFEYDNTPHLVDFSKDSGLVIRLKYLANKCCWLFGISGWVRIDFRVDSKDENRPKILEVNGNSCLSPDAGFQKSLQLAGIPFDAAIQRLLDDAKSKK